MIEDWQNAGFGLYVHWPFCQSKCPYCDFNSHVSQTIDHAAWRDALLAELAATAELTQGRTLNSIFFGGGTPSLMQPETVAAIIDAAHKHWNIANDLEVTLEANPSSIEAGKFQDFQIAGVNRVSMGMQALNDTDLKLLGRTHSAKEASQAFEVARNTFDRTSFDVIYGRQHQSLKDWKTELNQILSYNLDHVSLYQLTIEPNTRFGELYNRGKLRGLPSDDLGADMYAHTQSECEAAGLVGYEISNHARQGFASKHNLIYWRYGDYVGIGPGAHGRLTLNGQKRATTTPLAPSDWLTGVQKSGKAFSLSDPIPKSDQADEYLMMSLRLSEGTDLNRFTQLSGRSLNAEIIQELVDGSFVTHNSEKLIATPTGRIILNAIIEKLLT
ncbi:MAG: coproporphyrinogen III oxidase [Rhodobacteraceae bacterium]|nr:MAG: coproporphyrinogen III oxidase [Paracoccaceae bacterium]